MSCEESMGIMGALLFVITAMTLYTVLVRSLQGKWCCDFKTSPKIGSPPLKLEKFSLIPMKCAGLEHIGVTGMYT